MSESNLERARRIVDDIFRDVWERGHISEKDFLAIKDVARIAVESALDEAEARGAQAERAKAQRLVETAKRARAIINRYPRNSSRIESNREITLRVDAMRALDTALAEYEREATT
jgi:hypothetical protein